MTTSSPPRLVALRPRRAMPRHAAPPAFSPCSRRRRWSAAAAFLDRTTQIGAMPALSTIQDPQKQPGYKPVSLADALADERRAAAPTRCGRPAPRRLLQGSARPPMFGDILDRHHRHLRAGQAGQRDGAQRGSTARPPMPRTSPASRTSCRRSCRTPADPTNLLAAGSNSSVDGTGKITRTDQVNVHVAMLVTQVLPNGNLVVNRPPGRCGSITRSATSRSPASSAPQDISSINTISLDKIAEARVSYGRPRPADGRPAAALRPAALRTY